jgi:hypothetical protein
MPYCSQCGVEVDDNVDFCPLCRLPIQKFPAPADEGRPYPDKPAGSPPVPPLTLDEKMAISRTVSTIGILIPLLFVTAVDFFINRRITWSSYVIASLTGAWFITLVSLFFWKHPYILAWLIHGDILAFLFVVGRLMGRPAWFLPVALPLTAGSALFATLAIGWIVRLRRKGTNVAAVILLAIAFLCATIDFVLGTYLKDKNGLGWSLIVFSVLVPTVLLLFYIQSPRFSHSKLRKMFHF